MKKLAKTAKYDGKLRMYLPALILLFIGLSSGTSQNCTPVNTPPLDSDHWPDSSPETLYVDPALPAGDQQTIRDAASSFSAQTGQLINALAPGAPDPGTSTQGTIRIMNNAPGSPDAFANTQHSNLRNALAQVTTAIVSSTTSFNYGSLFRGSTVPRYDANQPNAAAYIKEVTFHELGHAFDVNDIPEPPQGYDYQPAGASIMNGSTNTNDQGPHSDPLTGGPLPGGVGAAL